MSQSPPLRCPCTLVPYDIAVFNEKCLNNWVTNTNGRALYNNYMYMNKPNSNDPINKLLRTEHEQLNNHLNFIKDHPMHASFAYILTKQWNTISSTSQSERRERVSTSQTPFMAGPMNKFCTQIVSSTRHQAEGPPLVDHLLKKYM